MALATFKPAILGALARTLPLERRVPARSVTVLMYHELGAESQNVNAWAILGRDRFLRQVALLRRFYDIVSIDEALRRLADPAAGQRPLAVLTFDDGDAGNHEILLPLIEREALPVTIYVATGHIVSGRPYWFDRIVNALQVRTPGQIDLRDHGLGIVALEPCDGTIADAARWSRLQDLLSAIKPRGNEAAEEIADAIEIKRMGIPGGGHGAGDGSPFVPLSIDQVRALAASPWVTIGAHTHGHELLTGISLEQARASVEHSRILLQSWTGRAVEHFAYPSGDRNAAVAAMLAQLGFRTAVGTHAGWWLPETPSMEIPRVSVGRFDSEGAFRINLVGGLRSLAGGWL